MKKRVILFCFILILININFIYGITIEEEIDINDWIRKGRDNQKTFFSEFQIEPPYEIEWKSFIPFDPKNYESNQKSELLSSEGILIINPTSLSFYDTYPIIAVDGFTGNILWKKTPSKGNDKITGTIHDGLYYNTVLDGGFPGYNLYTGNRDNSFSAGYEFGPMMGIYNNTAFFWAAELAGGADAYSSELLFRTGPRYQDTTGTFYKGFLYTLDDPNLEFWLKGWRCETECDLFRINTVDGSYAKLRDGMYNPPVADNNKLYVSDAETDKFYCLDLDGNIIWQTLHPDYYMIPHTYHYLSRYNSYLPIIGDDIVIFNRNIYRSEDRKYHYYLIALDKVDGEIKWEKEYSFPNSEGSMTLTKYPITSKDYIYFLLSYSNYNDPSTLPANYSLVTLDINTGNEIYKKDDFLAANGIIPANYLDTGFILANKRFYFHKNDSLYCLRGSNPAAFAGDDKISDVNEQIKFNGSESFTGISKIIVSYFWDFGDNNIGFGERTTHAYQQPGEYKVRLTITDNLGQQDSDELIARVSPNLNETKLANVAENEVGIIQLEDKSFAVFYQDEQKNLVLQHSLDGVNWKPAIQIYSNSNFSTASSKNNEIFLTFHDKTDEYNDKFIKIDYHSEDKVFNLNTPLIVDRNYEGATKNDFLLIDSKNRLWRVYTWKKYPWIEYWDVCYRYSDDKGSTWSEKINLFSDKGNRGYVMKAFLWNDLPAYIHKKKNYLAEFYYLDSDYNLLKGPTPPKETTSRGDHEYGVIVTNDNNIHFIYYKGDSIGYSYKDGTEIGDWSESIKFKGNLNNNPGIITNGENLWFYWHNYYNRIDAKRYYDIYFANKNNIDNPQIVSYAHENINPDLREVSKISSNKVPILYFRDNELFVKTMNADLNGCLNDIECSHLNTGCSYGICDNGKCIKKYYTSETLCRNALDECDIKEYCTGDSDYCPNNQFQSEGSLCSIGFCDKFGNCKEGILDGSLIISAKKDNYKVGETVELTENSNEFFEKLFNLFTEPSIIKNTGNDPIIGNLVIKIKKDNREYETVVDEITPRLIKKEFELKNAWPDYYFKKEGNYELYAKLNDVNGNIIQTQSGPLSYTSSEIIVSGCMPRLVNTSWGAWTNVTRCQPKGTLQQVRNLTQYDIVNCENIINKTFYEYKTVKCTYCAWDCTNKQCGDDGCGESCGTCGQNEFCGHDFQCRNLACTDSDNGLNYHEKGITSGCYSFYGTTVCSSNFTDYCVFGGYLYEYSCNKNVTTNTYLKCPSGCMDGACIDSCTNDADCDDETFCNGKETCINGKCYGQWADCNDNNICTIDFCSDYSTPSCRNNPITGCINDDGCCPDNCNSDNDNDCLPSCINNNDCNNLDTECSEGICSNNQCILQNKIQGTICSLGICDNNGNCITQYLNEDVNEDGKIDIVDLITISLVFGKSDCDSNNNWCDKVDVNKDGEVDILDLVKVALVFD